MNSTTTLAGAAALLTGLLTGLLGLMLSPSPAAACSPAPSSYHFEPSPERYPGDVSPPGAITEVDPWSTGGEPGSGCDDCGDLPARLVLDIYGAVDDQTPADQLGFRLTALDGDLPRLGFEQYGVVSTNEDAGRVTVSITFFEAGVIERDRSGTLRIEPIDGAGNVGPAFELVVYLNTEGEIIGCRAANARASQTLLPLLFGGLAIVGLRRRRRAPLRCSARR